MFLLFTQTSLSALVPEPDVTIYGTVYNHYKGADTILHNGNMTWTIKARDNNQETYRKMGSVRPQLHLRKLFSEHSLRIYRPL
ncbi:MAG: hypothetical protein OMM_07040 [Candidatus Magnetoglobus multicellularis str. Araruama]|uniref:Uncharacterized protein n=1 Tax=Candidatus Magnetoglobus multicellularis str. Araruama TaxID=890399 RepID=A0A1V1PF43_9BACT|nr:MAG: hypothetical protein OMM_07040 [Candidatus Magnetoglobus multicellularis str. Araruama]